MSGIEIAVDTLEDMCALMCDNIIPRKEAKTVDNTDEIKCGDCVHHRNYTGEWVCMNTESEYYGLETGYEDCCEEHEEK